ncbi:MAG: pseudouridine synthase [Cyclobacteriaceae bacterium]|nr:pseudouridine synthase [Cyclobacteriaceae bacterium]
MTTLQILYRDEYLIAINKPHGLLVHRSEIAADASDFALQMVKEQTGKYIYTIHRIDRKTGGVLLFSFDKDVQRAVQLQFETRKVRKRYLAIVRGHPEDKGTIDYDLTNDRGKKQSAVTEFATLERVELDFPSGKHLTSRYALLELYPLTGRHHQIRKHLSHINHPIIADRPHGCNKQNKLFLEKYGLMTMLLHASELAFTHPVTGEIAIIKAPLQMEFQRMIDTMGFSYFRNHSVL